MQLTGDLQKVSLPNLVQLVRNGGLTGKIALSCGAQQGLICFENGSIVHAEQELNQGRETLMELFLWNNGTFSFIESDANTTKRRSLDPKNPNESIEAILRDGIAYAEQQEFLEQASIDGYSILSPVTGTEKLVDRYDETTRAVYRGLDGKKPLTEAFTSFTMPRRTIVGAIYRLVLDRMIAVREGAGDQKTDKVELPEWVVQRLKQDNPNVSKAIVDMVIWADRVKCWLYQADSDFNQMLTELGDDHDDAVAMIAPESP
jgi:hypothetical protein